jgi:hypothetical protein
LAYRYPLAPRGTGIVGDLRGMNGYDVVSNTSALRGPVQA